MGKPSLLVVGCGDLGAAVATFFAADGWSVSGVRRCPEILPGVRTIAADVTQPASLQLLAELAPDYVLFALTPGGFSDERYRAVYVDGLRNCWQVLDRSRLQRIFWVSSTSVFHQDDGGWVDETSPTQPTGFSGQRLLEAEVLLAADGVAHTIIRFGGIYGPGRERLLRQLRGGTCSPLAPVRYSNRIHRDDAIGILQFLIQSAAAGVSLQNCYLGVDAEPTPIADVERWFCTQIGVDYAALTQQEGELRGGNRRCSSARLQALGYRFIYPSYREGLRTLLNA